MAATWNNWLGDFNTEATRLTPRSRDWLKKDIARVASRGGRVRAVGSGHSHSNAAQPSKGEAFIDLRRLDRRLSLDEHTFKPGYDKDTLVRVEGGMRLQMLTSQVLAKTDQGLLNMGSFDGQTVAGAVNTNTHGTGIALGGFADMVQSADMFVVVPDENLNPQVELWRLEPSDGMTDPAHAKTLRNQGIDRLVQSDRLFYSMIVSYGSVGIAYSYVLKVREFYWLEERKRNSTIGTLKNEIRPRSDGSPSRALTSVRHYWAILNTGWAQTGLKTDKIPAYIYRAHTTGRERLPSEFNPPKGKIHPIWPPMRKREAFREIAEQIHPPFTDIKDAAKFAALVDVNFKTKGEPFFHRGHRSAYYRVLRRARDNQLRVTDAPGNWDNTEVKAEPVAPTEALSAELAVPLDGVADLIDAIADSLGTKLISINMTTPMGLRFSAPSRHVLCPMYGRHTAFLEPAGVVERKKEKKQAGRMKLYRKALADLIADVEDKLGDELRPHLGKFNTLNRSGLEQRFPGARDWIEVQANLNAFGTWTGPFTKQFSLRPAKPDSARQWLREATTPASVYNAMFGALAD